ncbi:MAG: hypothetical protein PVH00_00740 [Gemmatimonadota bacterium]|jgi:hypothetical protein
MAGPAISFSETRHVTLSLGAQLRDGFTKQGRLLGGISATLRGLPDDVPPWKSIARPERGQFLFADLPAGAYTIEVRSAADTPYYRPIDIAAIVPMADATWPVLPERRLAQPGLDPDDPTQPAQYRQQLRLTTLQPTTAYPFPDGATVVRGSVRLGTTPLAQVRVRRRLPDGFGGFLDDSLEYETGADGEFALFYRDIAGMGEIITLRASHVNHPHKDQAVAVRRSRTTTTVITMTP